MRNRISRICSVEARYRYYERKLRQEFMRRAFTALAWNGINGDYAEFGCHGGMTFGLAYNESRERDYNCTMWAFDSFCGLPPQSLPEDQHPQWVEGNMITSLEEFKEICRHNSIPESEYRIISGFYEDSLTSKATVREFPYAISLAYIDCDLYSSTKVVLDFLSTRISHGSIIAFDDYYCYSTTALAGERLACAEFLKTNSRFHFSPYCQFGWHGMSFIVEDRSLWSGIDCAVLP
jgi:O-methyltransferase